MSARPCTPPQIVDAGTGAPVASVDGLHCPVWVSALGAARADVAVLERDAGCVRVVNVGTGKTLQQVRESCAGTG